MSVIDPAFNESGFDGWIASRPPVVQQMAQRVRYNRWYRLTTTGQYVMLYSYSEDGTVTVDVAACIENLSPFTFGVFGVDPDTLEECDAPESLREHAHE